MDAFLLSRLQFALNISFHILFPTITMAMGWFLFTLNFAQTLPAILYGCVCIASGYVCLR